MIRRASPVRQEVAMSGTKWLCSGVIGSTLVCGGLHGQESASPGALPVRNAATATTAPAKALAVVNGETITTADLEQALKQTGPSPVALTEAQTKQMKMELFRMLLDAALMRQFLTKYAPPASDAD